MASKTRGSASRKMRRGARGKKTTRRDEPDVTTVTGLLAWLKPRLDHRNVLDTACWVCAYWEAQELMEACTTKDVAGILQHGTPGIRSQDDIVRWLDQKSDEYETKEDMRCAVLEHLRDMGYEA